MAVAAPTQKDTPEFDTVQSIRKTADNMQLAENIRAADRALIDTLANGERPYTPEEVEKYQIKYNINWGELRNQIVAATRQLNQALLYKPTLFTATSQEGELEKRDEYSQRFTTKINRKLQKGDTGKAFRYLIKSRNASVALHGIGITYWPNDYDILPKFVPMENLLIPTDTFCDFSNLTFFCIKTELTPYELYERTHGDKVDGGWNLDQVHKILDGLKDLGTINTTNYNWVEYPEKMQEIWKQNRCYLNSDAVAKVKLNYWFSVEKETGEWFLKIYMYEAVGAADADEFVYEGNQAFADSLNKVIHVQYGDNSIVAPLQYHSVRGLGQSNYSAAEALNRFRSGLFQHGEEQLRMYFYVNAPADKARQNVIELFQYGIIEDGVKIVPETERHQVDASLIESIMAQCRQNLSENSTSYIQDVNDGTDKERTLGEAQIIQQSSVVAISSILNMMYVEETPFYNEIVRRILKKNSGVDEIEKFQKDLIADGIPKELLVEDNWEILPERVLGSGDQTLALQEAGALFQARSAFDPKSQRIIDRQFVSTVTRDPAKGLLLVPDAPDSATSGALAANDVFGTLMTGVPVALRQGITQNDYITEMMKMMGAIIQRISQMDNMGTIQEVIGLQKVGQDIAQHIAILESDKTQEQNVKIYGDALGKLMNLVKAFGQRIQASGKNSNPKLIESLQFKDLEKFPAAQAAFLQMAGLPNQMEPQADPKVQKAQVGLAIQQAKFEQKNRHAEIAFQMEQIRKNTEAANDLSNEQRMKRIELAHIAIDKLTELLTQSQQSEEQEQPTQPQSEKPLVPRLDANNPAHLKLAGHFMQMAGGDKNKARTIAQEHGFA